MTRFSALATLSKLDRLPKARVMLPLVSMSYGKPSRYSWVHRSGATRIVDQAEGGEQGDPLMPMLFALGIHDALERARSELQDGEHLFAYLDDVYAVCQPGRVRDVYDSLSRHLREVAGIRLHYWRPPLIIVDHCLSSLLCSPAHLAFSNVCFSTIKMLA